MKLITIWEIVGVLGTLGASVYSWVYSDDSAKKQNASFIAIMGVVFTLLMSLRFDVFPEMKSQLVLTENIAKNEEVRSLVLKLSDALIASSADPLMSHAFRTRLKSLREHLKFMGDGQFIITKEDLPSFVLELVKSAKVSFTATSYVSVNEWWGAKWAEKYFQENLAALKRNVKITRIFIFSDKKEYQSLKEEMDKQVSSGIDVYVAYVDDFNTKFTADMVLVDQSIGGELVLTPEKRIVHSKHYTKDDDIANISDRIKKVKLYATPYVGARQGHDNPSPS